MKFSSACNDNSTLPLVMSTIVYPGSPKHHGCQTVLVNVEQLEAYRLRHTLRLFITNSTLANILRLVFVFDTTCVLSFHVIRECIRYELSAYKYKRQFPAFRQCLKVFSLCGTQSISMITLEDILIFVTLFGTTCVLFHALKKLCD